MTETLPPLSEVVLARGHEMTAELREVAAKLSTWSDELTADKPETVDAQMHASEALAEIERAQTAIGVFTQIVAGMG